MSEDPLWAELYDLEGDEADFVVERPDLQPGLSFSAEAMASLQAQVMTFVGTRVMRRWNSTGEPPTVLLVRVSVKAQ